MEVMAQPFAGTLNPTLTVEVRVNGEKVTEWEFTDTSQQKRIATIPGDLLKKDKTLALIEFNVRDPISSKALGMNQDQRELGLGLSKLTFSQL